MLCTQVLNGLVRRSNVLSLDAGKDFDVVTVSFDPKETPALARDKKAAYLERYQPAGHRAGLALPDRRRDVDHAADRARRVPYAYDPAIDQYAHAGGDHGPDARGHGSRATSSASSSRPRDLRLGLVEASAGKIGSPIDQRCSCSATTTTRRPGSTALIIMRLVQAGGVATVAALGVFWLLMFNGAKRRRQRGTKPPL